jgi:hypothetical protein
MVLAPVFKTGHRVGKQVATATRKTATVHILEWFDHIAMLVYIKSAGSIRRSRETALEDLRQR